MVIPIPAYRRKVRREQEKAGDAAFLRNTGTCDNFLFYIDFIYQTVESYFMFMNFSECRF